MGTDAALRRREDGLEPVRLAVFASGSGSNLQQFLDAPGRFPDWPAAVVLVVSDKPASMAVERALGAGVPCFAHSPKEFADKAAYERAIVAQLEASRVQWIVLAGYMRIVGDSLLDAYEGRIVNVHPSLLPMFPGKEAVEQALAAGVTETGVTVHRVDRGMDTGPIVAQWRVPVLPGDDATRLHQRIQRVEHVLYPTVVGQLVREWAEEGDRS